MGQILPALIKQRKTLDCMWDAPKKVHVWPNFSFMYSTTFSQVRLQFRKNNPKIEINRSHVVREAYGYTVNTILLIIYVAVIMNRLNTI